MVATHSIAYRTCVAAVGFISSENHRHTAVRPCSRAFSSRNSIEDADIRPHESFIIEKIELDDTRQLELMSEFCINMFYGASDGIEDGTFMSKGWRSMKLAAMQKAQMLDLSMPTGGNRSIVVAKNPSSEIIGCCEVIEDRLDMSYYSDSNTNTISKQMQKKSSRLRPIIENLTVKPEYRRKGIGVELVNACERAIRNWIPKHDEIYAQVEEDNTSALNLFSNCGYTSLFVDPTCTKVTLENNLFAKQTTVSKVMFRKFLSNDLDSDFF